MVRDGCYPGLSERKRLIAAGKMLVQRQEREITKTREPNLVFPRTGKAWVQEDIDLIHSIIDDIPDESIDDHILWLSKQQGRTPYAIALKIVSEGRMNKEWAKRYGNQQLSRFAKIFPGSRPTCQITKRQMNNMLDVINRQMVGSS